MTPTVTGAVAPAAATANVDLEKGNQQVVVANGRTWMPVSSKTVYIGLGGLFAVGCLATAIFGTVWFAQNKHPKDGDEEAHHRRKIGLILLCVFWPVWCCCTGGAVGFKTKE